MNEQVHYIYTDNGLWVGIAQLVYRVATGWMARGSNPGGDIFRSLQNALGPTQPPKQSVPALFFGGNTAGAWR